MHNSKKFNDWAKEYNLSVDASKEGNVYPFAGYDDLMDEIYHSIKKGTKLKILDIGFGTARFTSKLYNDGHDIVGIDFSSEMIEIASKLMPNANLIEWDFSKGVPDNLVNEEFDLIISTYAIHHLDDNEKVIFLNSLKRILKDDGMVFIGDVAFETRKLHDECMVLNEGRWDTCEIYIKYDELVDDLKYSYKEFKAISFCSGIVKLCK